MQAQSRVLVIGLDSADRTLLHRYVEEGRLPVIASLVERSGAGLLKSPPALGDDAAWASFATSLSPGRHGRYYHKHMEPGTYRTPWFRDHHFAHAAFWQTLSDAGCNVGVIDVPKCPLGEIRQGLQICDWLVHGRDGETRSAPESLAPDILRRFGDDDTDRPGSGEYICGMPSLSHEQERVFLERLLNGLEQKVNAASELLARGGWDLFLVVFKECHCVQHHFWHLLDESHPAHDPQLIDRLGNPVLRVFQALDRAVGTLIEQSGPDTKGILFSDLGMTSNYTADHLLDEALLRMEPAFPAFLRGVYRDGVRIEEKLRSRFLPRSERSFFRGMRRAYQVDHNEISGAIRINLAGREPSGRVRPGVERDALCDELASNLMELVDPDTGERVVERIVRADEAFPGERRDHLPDLFAVWRRERPITGLASPKIGEVRVKTPEYRPGNHVENGFFVSFGCDERASRAREASLEDIGPTIAKLLGKELPDVDGEPIAGVE
ncbi:MAG: hypothetical protein HKN20_03190 [Gemmatimonadetes bacterium]|nr:hypothetical protein [Gemmatimonadota bacterium]